MKNKMLLAGLCGVALCAGAAERGIFGLYGDTPDAKHAWAVHDLNRPYPKQVETPEGEFATVKAADIVKAVNKPMQGFDEQGFDERTTVTAIRVEGLGEFYYNRKYNCIDWRTVAGEEVSLGPAWWIQLTEDLPMVMKKLGVEL